MERMENLSGGGDHNQATWLPPGFRFHPTDEELITYYLVRKLADGSFRNQAVTEVDLNKHEPWDLPGKAEMVGEKEWYFYSVKDRKYPSGLRTNRATQAGYWKATGKDKEVFMKSSSRGHCKQQLVGFKKTLVFYEGRAPNGLKSNWVMHEYRMDEHARLASILGNINGFTRLKATKEQWVLCRVFHKKLRHGQSKRVDVYSQEDDAEMLAAAAHFFVADEERGRGGAVAGYSNKLAKLPPYVAAAPAADLAGADKFATTLTGAGSTCSSSKLEENDYEYAACRAAEETEGEHSFNYLLQEHSLKQIENYSSCTSGCSDLSDKYCDGMIASGGGDFSNASFSNACTSSDARLPAASDAAYASYSPLPRFPSELESFWLHASAFLA